jgi:type I restriction enzyme M protein
MSKTEYKPKEEILTTGEEKGLIKIGENRVEYVAPRKSYQFTDPEEKVRARVYVEIIEKYKYPAKRIDTEVMPPRLLHLKGMWR